jgi:hypothetical protein
MPQIAVGTVGALSSAGGPRRFIRAERRRCLVVGQRSLAAGDRAGRDACRRVGRHGRNADTANGRTAGRRNMMPRPGVELPRLYRTVRTGSAGRAALRRGRWLNKYLIVPVTDRYENRWPLRDYSRLWRKPSGKIWATPRAAVRAGPNSLQKLVLAHNPETTSLASICSAALA